MCEEIPSEEYTLATSTSVTHDYYHHPTPRRRSYAHNIFTLKDCFLRSGIHHIGIFIFLVILNYRHFLFTTHLFAAHWASSFAAQPGSDALEVELMMPLAGKLDDKAVLILQVGNL